MPDKSTTVLSYAAGASLAAVALIYVFGPTFAIDHETSSKKTIVGLQNQANDCFINSVLQALAGLGDLRIYLIRETHRRHIQDPGIYTNLVQPRDGSKVPDWRLSGLQDGMVTRGLKDMLDALNERPIARKSISPFPFVRVLETAFRQRISRQQQDAQEFLQIVAERLKDEYHAGERARHHAQTNGLTEAQGAERPTANAVGGVSPTRPEAEDGFPMEGKYESHVQCQTCRYRTKAKQETFCTLTLAVPHASSTSLNSCFDGIFKTELIDDFKCEMCRLVQTKTIMEHELARSTSQAFCQRTRDSIDQLRHAMETDPEKPPKNVPLGDMRYAPKRTIAKTTRMTVFPKILALHLSRSIYGAGQTTVKNSAKVAFPEQLQVGGLADRRRYRLVAIITHQGGHNSGHYEAFRRQNQPSPYHNTNTFQPSGAYSRTGTPVSTPNLSARTTTGSPAMSAADLVSSSPAPGNSSRPSLESPPRSIPDGLQPNGKDKAGGGDSGSLRSVAASTKSTLSRLASPARHSNHDDSGGGLLKAQLAKAKKRKPPADKWWRVSDEKVREAKTSEVLDMQREVYMLFYEVDEDASC